MVTTEVSRNMHWIVRTLESVFYKFLEFVRKTPEEGAYCSVYAATAEELEGKGGLYLSNCQPAEASAAAKDTDVGAKLWALSEHLSGIKNYESRSG